MSRCFQLIDANNKLDKIVTSNIKGKQLYIHG